MNLLSFIKPKKQKQAKELMFRLDTINLGEDLAKKRKKEKNPKSKYKILEQILDRNLLPYKTFIDITGVALIQSAYFKTMPLLDEFKAIEKARETSQDYVKELSNINEMNSIIGETYPTYIFNLWLEIKEELKG